MTAASLIDGLSVRVGYCSQTTAALTVVALQDGTLDVACSGGVPAVTVDLTEFGADNPSRPGEAVGLYGKVDITGLSAGTAYTYTVTKGAESVSGSFRTQPAAGQDFAFIMGTCERHDQFSPVDVFALMREYCEAQTIPVSWYAHIDDNSYVDSMSDWGYSPTRGMDATTGLALTNAATKPQGTGLAWDYGVNWLGYFGLIPSWMYTKRESRLWWLRNMPLWAQWGDHEVASNWQRGHGGQGDWYGPKEWTATVGNSGDAAYDADFAPAGVDNFFDTVSVPLWEALFGQALPPKLGATGQHWGVAVGSMAFAAPDMNTYADGRHYLTTGTGAGCGRKADGSIDLGASGDSTLPYLGSAQIGELLGFYATADKPFNILFTANGIASHNEPWGQWWTTDFDDLMARATTGVLNQTRLNGTTGKLAVLKGDSHIMHVCSYHADGTAGGLGGAAHDAKELWEICPGTTNGSGTAPANFQYKLFNEKLRFIQNAVTERGRDYHSFMHVTVYESETPKRVEVRMIETTNGVCETAWAGQWVEDVAGNAFTGIASRPSFG